MCNICDLWLVSLWIIQSEIIFEDIFNAAVSPGDLKWSKDSGGLENGPIRMFMHLIYVQACCAGAAVILCSLLCVVYVFDFVKISCQTVIVDPAVLWKSESQST